MDIKNIVNDLCKKHKTSCPYELADSMGIVMNRMDLGKMRGFYFCKNRIKLIYLNADLPEHLEKFVLAHEIGHSVLHPQTCTPFLQTTFFSVDRLEVEANKFAINLVMSDEEITEHLEYTIDEWAMYYGLPREVIELKFK